MEDLLWQNLYRGMETKTSRLDHSIQDFDNGFFEKFGTLLHEQVKNDDEILAEGKVDCEISESSEEEPEENKDDLISDAVGLNIDTLYEEVLYEILHLVGADTHSSDKNELFDYTKDVFKVDDEKLATSLEKAQSKQAPSIILNIEVMEGKNLTPKDANGLSDPFCTLYLSSMTSHRYNTSVKTETLTPLWEEHFSLPVDDATEDILFFEVWDFDPAETVKEKMSKISGVKGVKGLRKLMKEIAVTASTGKHDNEMIGCVNIPLKCIPSYGHVKWYTLEKKSKTRGQGLIKLKLAFSSEKNKSVAFQEERYLLRLLLLHEIDSGNIDATTWDGLFPEPSDTLLRQHAAQSGLSQVDESLARWTELTRFHSRHPFSFQLFTNVLNKIVQPLKSGLYSDEEVKLFWDSVARILPFLLQYIRKLKKYISDESSFESQLMPVLKILAVVASESQNNEKIELFPKCQYGWLDGVDPFETDIIKVVKKTIHLSAVDWFEQIIDKTNFESISNEEVLKYAIKITQVVRSDLLRIVEQVDKHFLINLEIQYSAEVYPIYDAKICELVEPYVTKISSLLKPMKLDGNNTLSKDTGPDSLAIGTLLFELYLLLQKLYLVGQGIFPVDTKKLQIYKFHTWFYKGVTHWLEIAVYKATQRIEKAIQLDDLKPVDSSVKYTSSSVDTLAIFYQIKIFWTQLSWPDAEGNYTFMAKIIDDICRCSVYYADMMADKVASEQENYKAYGKIFQVTNEWCLAINNIDYIRQSILPFVKELGTDDIIQKLSELRNSTAAEHCRQTLALVVENALDNVRNKIIDMLDATSSKMAPVIKSFLQEGAEILNHSNNHVERLMQYLDDNLTVLNSQLNNDNFERIFTILWENIYDILNELIQASMQKRRPASFFSNLDATLNILVGFFKQTDSVENSDVYQNIKKLLKLHGMDTEQLIHSYYLERLAEQNDMTNSPCGMLTIKIQFANCFLRIEILNARNLIPHDSNGSCDPYVKIQLMPKEKFFNVIKPKTKIQKRNLFPLFDESFAIQLTKEQQEVKDGLVHLIVKDQDFLGMSNQFVAEAFVPFSDIPKVNMDTSLKEMAQVHLKLSIPTNQDSDVLKVLDHRQGEKLAKDFIKRQKAKLVTNSNNENV